MTPAPTQGRGATAGEADGGTGEFPPIAILCGGRGTRLRERTQEIPKALVEIGGRPILWHVIRLCAAQGFRRFVLCTGYRRELIEEFADGTAWPQEISLECHDTGQDTPTGGRVRAVADHLGDSTFIVAYADGLADIRLGELVSAHRERRVLATMTVVQPRSQFGVASLGEADQVTGFEEKPPLDRWVNGGFFCFEPGVLGYLSDSGSLEGEPLQALAADGQLFAFRHQGFWECMDTYKDAVALNDRWSRGEAPWALWDKQDNLVDTRPPGAAPATTQPVALRADSDNPTHHPRDRSPRDGTARLVGAGE